MPPFTTCNTGLNPSILILVSYLLTTILSCKSALASPPMVLVLVLRLVLLLELELRLELDPGG